MYLDSFSMNYYYEEYTFLIRMLTDNEKNILQLMMVEYTEAGYRAKIILLKNNGYTASEIRRMATNHHHDRNIESRCIASFQ
jgi:hypothetical protein